MPIVFILCIINLLKNNIGKLVDIVGEALYFTKIELNYWQSFNRIDQIDINIKGNLHILSACIPSMRENGYGRVIMISSVLAEKPVVSTGVYSGCKGFLDSLAKTVAVENMSKNEIRALASLPPLNDTPTPTI